MNERTKEKLKSWYTSYILDSRIYIYTWIASTAVFRHFSGSALWLLILCGAIALLSLAVWFFNIVLEVRFEQTTKAKLLLVLCSLLMIGEAAYIIHTIRLAR